MLEICAAEMFLTCQAWKAFTEQIVPQNTIKWCSIKIKNKGLKIKKGSFTWNVEVTHFCLFLWVSFKVYFFVKICLDRYVLFVVVPALLISLSEISDLMWQSVPIDLHPILIELQLPRPTGPAQTACFVNLQGPAVHCTHFHITRRCSSLLSHSPCLPLMEVTQC